MELFKVVGGLVVEWIDIESRWVNQKYITTIEIKGKFFRRERMG